MFSRNRSRLRDRGNLLRASTTPCVEALECRQLLSGTTNPGGAPNAPFALSASVSGTGPVQFSFIDSADNETGFEIRRSTAGGPYVDLTTLGASMPFHAKLTYSDFSVVAGTSYSYEVLAVNGPYSSSTAGPVSVQLAPPPGGTTTNPGGAPNAPFGLSAKANPAGGATFSFFDSATNETGFVIQRATGAAGPFVTIGSTSPAAGTGQSITFNDSAAATGTTYYYTAYAVNGGYFSSKPTPVSVTIPGTAPMVPSAPGNVTAVALSPTSIQITFTNTANNETGFSIHRYGGGDDIGGGTTLNEIVGVGQLVTWTDTGGVQPGHTYQYTITAFNAQGDSTRLPILLGGDPHAN